MTGVSAAFDFNGTSLSVVAPQRSWIDPFNRMLDGFAVDDAVGSTFQLVIRENETPGVPKGVPMIWEGDLLEGRPGRIYETDSLQIIEVINHGYLVIDYAASNAEAVMKPGSEEAFAFTPLVNVLDAALGAGGKHLLHGACLTVQDGSSAIVIIGPSGYGKTTTALALARGGFGLVSDDATVVENCADGHLVWGLPRNCKVHRRTVELMPWIGNLPDAWNDEDEQSVTVDSLRRLVRIAAPVPRCPKALLLLGPRSAGDHRLSLLSKAQALLRIAQDNVSNSRTGVKAWSRHHFEAYSAMVRRTPVLQLNVGQAVDSLPDQLDATLSRLGLQ